MIIMCEKIALSACNGMSKFGLVGRAVSSDLAYENQNIISICLTSTSACDENPDFLNKYPIIALNGCSNECVNKLLDNKESNVYKTINIMDFSNEKELEPGDVARLGEKGEKVVKELKEYILEEYIHNL